MTSLLKFVSIVNFISRRKIILVIILMLMKASLTYSQYQVNHFTTENGLPSNGVKGLQLDDSTGFLWIATEAGLVRYNGIGFNTFNFTTDSDLGSSRIVVLAKNPDNKIYIAGESGNLMQVKENLIKLYLKGENTALYNYNYFSGISLSDALFKKCLKDPWPIMPFSVHNTTTIPLHDTAALALCAGNLYRYTLSTDEPSILSGMPENIKSIFTVGNRVYGLSVEGLFYSLDILNQKYQQKAVTNEDGSKFEIDKNNSNLFWQPGMQKPVVIQHQQAWVIEHGKNNNLQFRLVASGIPQNTFFNYAQYKEKGDYLFLSSASKGLYIFHSNQLMHKGPATTNINQPNSMYSQVELPDGNILTNSGSIIGDAGQKHDYNIGKFINSVYNLKDGTIMFWNNDSLYKYSFRDNYKKLIFTRDIHEKFGLTYAGNKLYFADQGGIATIDNKDSLQFLKKFDEKATVHLGLSNMLEISPGKLALTTCEGLLQFDTKTKKLDTLLKLPSICIREIHQEGDYFFIGTYGGGYYILKNGILKAMPLDVNQYLKYSHCFMKDNYGFYWISTNNGLFKVKLADIIEAYEKNLTAIYYHYLGKEDGMVSTEMNGGCTPCAITRRNGEFSFPTMDGLLWVNAHNTNIELPSGKIYLDQMLVDGKPENILNNESLRLPERVKKIDILLAINAWCKKENLYIEYQLDKENWQPAELISDVLKISFNNLGYGNHLLQIRKLNGFGVNNYSYSTISFTIATPFYHQWWFRVLAILSLLGIGYLFFRWRLQQYEIREEKLSAMVEEKTMDLHRKNIQLEKNNDIKTRLISIINHDIITPLKFMTYTGKALTESKLAIKPEEQLEIISEITQTAKDMEMLSSQILSWIIYQNPDKRMQKEEFDLHQLVEMVFGVLKFSEKEKNTKLINEVPPHFVIRQYLEPLRVMLYNLVMNSLNFTREGTITVSCIRKADNIILSVSDTGLGMTAEQINNLMQDERIISSANVDNKKGTGLGYLIIKDLLKMMEGSLNVRSGKNEGTTVSVSLPEPEDNF